MHDQTLITHLMSHVWFQFGLVTLLGFMTGLELHGFLEERKGELSADEKPVRFGTSRTCTFISMSRELF